MQAQFVVEIHRFRLSKRVWPNEVSRKITAHVEGLYRNKVVRSAEYVVAAGAQLPLPWSTRLDKVTLRFYYIDDRLKVELGFAEYDLAADKAFDHNGKPTRLLLHIAPRGGETPIGKVQCTMSVMYLYEEEGGRPHRIREAAGSAPIAAPSGKEVMQEPVPDFRFKRLSKIINWSKIRAVDIERVSSTNDVRTLQAFLNDVALGDVAMEDSDPLLLKAMQLAQFSCQYVLGSNKLLEDKATIVRKALKAFQEEDDLLELKVAKLKAKKRAMRKEVAAMDDIAESYIIALIGIDGRLAKAAHNSYYKPARSKHRDDGDSEDDKHGRKHRERATRTPREEEQRHGSDRHQRHDEFRDSRSRDSQDSHADTRPWKETRASPRGYSGSYYESRDKDRADDLHKPINSVPVPAQSGLWMEASASKQPKARSAAVKVEEQVDKWTASDSPSEENEIKENKHWAQQTRSAPVVYEEPVLPVLPVKRTSVVKTVVVGQLPAPIPTASVEVMQRGDDPISTFQHTPLVNKAPSLSKTLQASTAMSADSLNIASHPADPLGRTYPTDRTRSSVKVKDEEELMQDVESSLLEEELGESIRQVPSAADYEQEVHESDESSMDPMSGLPKHHVSPMKRPVLRHEMSVDASQSVVLDYSDTMTSDQQPRRPAIRFDDSVRDDSGPLSRNNRSDTSSPLVGRRDGEDDMVLMGTMQLTAGTGTMSMERDSLGGTGRSMPSEGSSVMDMHVSPDESAEAEEEEEDSYGTNTFEEPSEMAAAPEEIDDVPLVATQRTDESFDQVLSSLSWSEGRAPVELLELSSALEINVGAIGLNRKKLPAGVNEVHVTVEFLDTKSPPSRTIKLDGVDAIYPLTFTSHMVFDESTSQLLAEEIQEIGDTLGICVNVLDSKSGDLLGQGVVEVWNMIEHRCNILRQEVDIYTFDMTAIVGLLVVDVKGYMLMDKCSNL